MSTHRSFSDLAVIPCRPGDPRLTAWGYSENAVGYEQASDGPTFLVVGHQSPQEALDRACRCFGMDRFQVMAALKANPEEGNQP